MKNKVLYVIGNGFDIHHGIRSRYADFKMYLQEKDSALLQTLEKYFPADTLWSDFEGSLGFLETEDIKEANSNYLMDNYGGDWKDSSYHDFQYEVGRVIDALTKEMKQQFTQWILEVRKFPNSVNERTINLNKVGRYLNFNYTDTLERVYNVAEADILYIHNKAVDDNSNLILGHSRQPKSIQPQTKPVNNDEDDHSDDFRVREADQILDTYWKENYKPTNAIVAEQKAFFESLKDIEEVHILGHSLAPVDMPYFAEIAKNIDLKKVRWLASFHDKKKIPENKKALEEIGVAPDLIRFDRLRNFYSTQLSLFEHPRG